MRLILDLFRWLFSRRDREEDARRAGFDTLLERWERLDNATNERLVAAQKRIDRLEQKVGELQRLVEECQRDRREQAERIAELTRRLETAC